MRGADVRRLLQDRRLQRMGRQPGRREGVLVGRGQRRDRHLRRRDRRVHRDVEREPLQRVVQCPDVIEVAPEPAGAQARVGPADLVVVPRGEVRLVRVVVADGRHDGDLPLAVQRRQPARRGMPAQPAVLGEGTARGLREGEVRP